MANQNCHCWVFSPSLPVVIYIAVGNLVDLNTRTIIGFIGLIFLALSFLNAIGGTLYFYLRLGARSPGFVCEILQYWIWVFNHLTFNPYLFCI